MIAEAPGAETFGKATPNPSIFDEIRQIGFGSYQYYRQPNGWIDFGKIGKQRSHEAQAMRCGWRPLGGPNAAILGTADYGEFEIAEYYLEHPHEVLFMRGGAHEMPVEQIIALGYHLRPPLVPRCGLQIGAQHKQASDSKLHLSVCWKGAKPVHFPQLAGRTFADPGACLFCDRRDFATAQARNQHVRVMHKDDMNQMSLADAIVKGVQAAQRTAVPDAVALDPAEAEAAEAARRAAEQEAIDLKMRAMGLLDDEPADDDAALLAASEADGEPDTEAAPPKRSHHKKQ